MPPVSQVTTTRWPVSRPVLRRRVTCRVALAVYWLVLLTVTHWPGLRPEQVPDLRLLPFDKAMHILTFCGLAGLIVWAELWRRGPAWRDALLAIVVGVVYGGLEELTQPMFSRTASWADLLADVVGLSIGAAVAVGLRPLLGSWFETTADASTHSSPPGGDGPRSESEGASSVEPTDSKVTTPSAGGGFVGHAVLVSGLTLVSRLTGLIRDAVLAGVFGATLWLDAFLIGFLVPNLFRRLFGEGALTAAFIPRYTRLLKDDPALARRFASLCVVLVATLLAVLTVAGEAVMTAMLVAAEPGKATAALRLTMTMLPYMPLVCGVAFLGAVLQVHKRFGPPAAAPIVLNGVMILAAWLVSVAVADDAVRVRWVALSVLIAGGLQIAWLLIEVARRAPLTLSFAGTRPAFLAMLRTMVPMVIGLGVFQINTLLDGLIAYFMAAPADDPAATFTLLGTTRAYPMEAGAVTTLTLAQRLYQFPLGVFGIAIATAIFPALSHAAAKREPGMHAGDDEFAAIFRRGLRLTVFIGLPASIGLILVRVPLTRVFFERGAFTTDAALRSAGALAGYASAVWAYSMTHVMTKAFYAADDAMTPLKVSAGMVALNLTLNLLLIWPLGAAGLAWSTAISATLQVGLLLLLLRRHVHRPVDAAVVAGWLRVLGLSMLMGAAVWAVIRAFDVEAMGTRGCLGVLGLCVAVGGVVFLGGAWLARLPETRWLRRRGG